MIDYNLKWEASDYLKYITSQYCDKPNFIAYNKAFLDKLCDAREVVYELMQKFNIDEAEGDLLDKIGELFNISRSLPNDNNSLPDSLPDEDYRVLIKATAASSKWDGTIQGLIDIFNAVFPNSQVAIEDNEDMTARYVIFNPDISANLQELFIEGYILPKPAGVAVNYLIVIQPVFGWDLNSSNVKGWDIGLWV